LLDGIDWTGVVAQALQTGGALVMVLLAWTVPRVAWRGVLWWFKSGSDRGVKAEQAALAKLVNEAEQRGFRRGWSAAVQAQSDREARMPPRRAQRAAAEAPQDAATTT